MPNVVKRISLLAPLLMAVVALGCSSQEKSSERKEKNWENKKFALAQGTTADGKVKLRAFFKETKDGLKVNLLADGLQPNAVHGIHIHENGVCNEPDFTSAGAHFDPASTELHGGPGHSESHLGDLGNLTAGPQGYARNRLEIKGATLTEGSTNVVGRALILHAGPDDLTTQPAGASGSRLVCAVIELGDKAKMKEFKKDGMWKEGKRKGKMKRDRKHKHSDPKAPEAEQKPSSTKDQPGSTTDAEI